MQRGSQNHGQPCGGGWRRAEGRDAQGSGLCGREGSAWRSPSNSPRPGKPAPHGAEPPCPAAAPPCAGEASPPQRGAQRAPPAPHPRDPTLPGRGWGLNSPSRGGAEEAQEATPEHRRAYLPLARPPHSTSPRRRTTHSQAVLARKVALARLPPARAPSLSGPAEPPALLCAPVSAENASLSPTAAHDLPHPAPPFVFDLWK